MKLLLLISVLFLSIILQAQTYAPYTGNKANETKVSKPAKNKDENSKPVIAEKIQKEELKKPTDDFQDLMNKAVEQFNQKDYRKAESFYTRALDVSTEETAWRALLSRATLYGIMKDDKKAVADLTTAIDSGNTPEKQLAMMYMQRARIEAKNKNMDFACNDVAKAKALGLPDVLTQGVECK
ncbi:hypothetical protein [Flavobacterium sp. AG291]|uniref:hypothetical protein n=1 Tax=Flavobacterium sp. AG291 TaxID=2184000 RepID=UPI000E0AC1FC|nr:hypothetical protein [Flavobacterium sp. AG291]RDI05456.1 hypothetical protein DEU42_11718 [Flavobacterium sp. AG291]